MNGNFHFLSFRVHTIWVVTDLKQFVECIRMPHKLILFYAVLALDS